MNIKFNIVVLCYNCESYIKQCIDSIKSQTYTNCNVVIINDNSTDNTHEVIAQNINKKFNYINNKSNTGPLSNHIKAIETFEYDPEAVIVHVDGDDLLLHPNVLSIVAKAYTKNTNHLVSYGNYVTTSGQKSICKLWDKNINISNYIAPVGWIFSHLRTFKFKLWNYIDKNISFYDSNKKIYTSAGDVAIMKPILELAGRGRTMFFNSPLYLYRDNTTLNEHNKNLNDQVRCALDIKTKKEYKIINE